MKYLLPVAILMAFFVSCNGNGGGHQPPPPEPPSGPACGPLIDLPPRGVSMLHCDLNKPRPQCESLVQLMKDSCVKRLAVGYLVDDVFGFRPTHIQHDLTQLSSEGREVSVNFYLMNGPWQRRCNDHPNGPFDVRMCAPQFNSAVKGDPGTRTQVKARAERLVPLIQAAKALGVTVYVTPMLEDNMDNSAFAAVMGIIKPVLDPHQVRYVRNGGTGHGAQFTEVHNPEHRLPGAIMVNDGVTYEFPGEHSTYPRKISEASLRSAFSYYAQNGPYWIAWHAGVQGLTSGTLPPPEQRNYRTLSAADKQFLINLLRHR